MADVRTNAPNPLLQRAATYLIVPTILFIVLSPGLLLEVRPPSLLSVGGGNGVGFF
jgi:hypothetical protein